MVLTFFMAAALVIWGVSLGLTVFGSAYALKRLRQSPPHLDAPFGLYPVSILKPLKGVDPGLRQNLESFFHLDYPGYEIIFSVADARDPAFQLASELIRKYPSTKAKLIVGEENVGPNPKVNNLIQSYEQSRYDLVLISDSNILAKPDYVRRLVAHLDSGVGMVTSLVAGRGAEGLGSWLEAAYLNSFYARWMFAAEAFGKPCVVGKSMLFRKSVARRFGGMRVLGRYLAEDYMAGEAVRKLGLDVIVACDPVEQRLGRQPVSAFWSRHLRWGRIRKSQAPVPFLGELVFGFIFSGVLGALGCGHFWGVPALDFWSFHLAAWSVADLALSLRLEAASCWRAPLIWLFREILAVPLWLHTAAGNTVQWRGRQLKLVRGGLLDPSVAGD